MAYIVPMHVKPKFTYLLTWLYSKKKTPIMIGFTNAYTVECRYNTVQYWELRQNVIRCWIHKRHPIPHPNGVSLVNICEKIDHVIRALYCTCTAGLSLVKYGICNSLHVFPNFHPTSQWGMPPGSHCRSHCPDTLLWNRLLKSMQFIWRSSNCRWNLQVPALHLKANYR